MDNCAITRRLNDELKLHCILELTYKSFTYANAAIVQSWTKTPKHDPVTMVFRFSKH